MVDRALSDLIGLIYEAALQPRLWDDVLERTAAVAPSAVATLYTHDMLARTPTFHAQFGVDPFFQRQYVEKYAATNPIIEAIKMLEPGQVAGLDANMDFEAFMRTPFYNEWGAAQGFVDGANILLERTSTRVSSVSLIRHARHGRTDRATLERLEILAPHFLRSVRLGRALEYTNVEKNALEAALDKLAAPIVLLDAKTNPVHANKSALTLFATGLRFEAIRGTARRVFGTGATSVGDQTFTVTSAGGERYVCHWTALSPDAGADGGAGPSSSLMVLSNASLTQKAAQSAAAAFKLTPRESDVLFHVAELGGVSTAHSELGLSKSTVRSHLRSVFVKTQTHSQAELVKLANEFATPFLPPSSDDVPG